MMLLHAIVYATFAFTQLDAESPQVPVRFPAHHAVVAGETLIGVLPASSADENSSLCQVELSTPAERKTVPIPGTSLITDSRGHPLAWEYAAGQLHYMSVTFGLGGHGEVRAIHRRISPAELQALPEKAQGRLLQNVPERNNVGVAWPVTSRMGRERIQELGPAYYGMVVQPEDQFRLLILSADGLQVYAVRELEWALIATIPTTLRGPFQVTQFGSNTCLIDEGGKVFRLGDDRLEQIGSFSEWSSIVRTPSAGKLVILRDGDHCQVLVANAESVRTLQFVSTRPEDASVFTNDELSEQKKAALSSLSTAW